MGSLLSLVMSLVMFQSNRVTEVRAKRKRMINFTIFLYSIISSSTKFICSINILALNSFACSFRLDKYWCLVFHAKNCFHQRKFGGTHQALGEPSNLIFGKIWDFGPTEGGGCRSQIFIQFFQNKLYYVKWPEM